MAIPDHEVVYQLLHDHAWADLLALVHTHRDAATQDPLFAQAVGTAVQQLLQQLDADRPARGSAEAEALETLFLLHTGHFYRLPELQFGTVIEHLVIIHAERPEMALGYARFAPDRPICAALLAEQGSPDPIEHAQDDILDVRHRATDRAEARVRPLFRSQQEEAFFLAVREVYATYFAYPNVALSTVLNYDALAPELTADERTFFFRGHVDCVVLDQHDGYRPLLFFELDSPWHDAPERQRNDRLKDRILALAGCDFYRLRHHGPRAHRADFVRLLRELNATGS